MRRAMRVLIPVAVLLLFGLVALAFQGTLRLPQLDLAGLVPESAPARVESPAATPAPSQPPPTATEAPAKSSTDTAVTVPAAGSGGGDAPRIEFARIDADGASVIGGRAPANSRVTVLANGDVVAEVAVSEDGQWSAIVTRAFAPGPLTLALRSNAPGVDAEHITAITLEVPKGSGRVELAAATPKARPILPPRSAAPDNRALTEFAAVVERARASGGRNDGSAGREGPIVPVPITFVTGSATMTAEGLRAAGLLADYIGIVKPGAITLSGHADVRGGDAYNLELSRQRLVSIETYLRKRGYQGRLSLMAKGKSEPYLGIDRTKAAIEDVYQADRRVEFRLAE